MAKNSIEAYGAKGKSNVLYFDPDDLVIVDDPKHPLYDERIHLPISEPLVLNIMFQGVLESIVVTKDPELGKTLVVDGRQRVRAAREANKRLRKQGSEPVLVPALPRRGEAASLAGVMVSANEIREDDTPLNRAKKMQRLLELGRSEEDLTILFGCSLATVKNTLALLECTAAVRSAVESGKINVTHAYKLSKKEPEEQRETLDKMLKAAGEETGKRKRSRKMREAVTAGPKVRSKSEIAAMVKRASDGRRLTAMNEAVKSALEWVLGESDDEPFEEIKSKSNGAATHAD